MLFSRQHCNSHCSGFLKRLMVCLHLLQQIVLTVNNITLRKVLCWAAALFLAQLMLNIIEPCRSQEYSPEICQPSKMNNREIVIYSPSRTTQTTAQSISDTVTAYSLYLHCSISFFSFQKKNQESYQLMLGCKSFMF